jgi:hypothetical protein
MNTVPFDATKVTKIYMGKDNHCRCGCAGEYLVRDTDSFLGHSPEKFAKRVARFAKMWCEYEPQKYDVTDNYLNISYGQNRALTVYFD